MKKINPYFCYLLFFIPVFLLVTLSFESECDIWFLFSHGRYVLEHGFPHVDFLSMHEGLHFVMQQWLSSVLFYSVYKMLGSIGVYLLVWIVSFVMIYVIYRLCKTICSDLFLSCVLTIILFWLLEFCFIVCRPGIFSLLAFLCLLWVMECYSKKKSKNIYWLVLISFLQVNLHASMWPVLFILLLPYLVQYGLYYLQKKDKTIFTLLFVIFLMILVGFLNPYGLESMTYSFRSYGVSDINNIVWEMHGLDLSSELDYVKFFGIITFFVMVAVTFIYIHTKKNVSLYRLLLFYGTFFMALANIRNISLFFICSIPFCSSYISFKTEYQKKHAFRYRTISIFMIVLLVAFIIWNHDNYILSNQTAGQKEVLNYLNQHANKKDPIYTMNSHGSFFSYYGYKTYIDTRAEVFLKKNNHKEDIYHEFYLLMNNKINYSDFLKKYQFPYLIVEETEPFNRYLESSFNTFYHPVYYAIYYDNHLIVYEKNS